MKSFEEHLRGAKAHNREDKIWLVTCFSGKMAKLCAKYGFPDDEERCSTRSNSIFPSWYQDWATPLLPPHLEYTGCFFPLDDCLGDSFVTNYRDVWAI